MKHYPHFAQEDFNEVQKLITETATCLLLTTNSEHDVQIGVFNPIYFQDKIYLHLHRKDEQTSSLRSSPKAKLIFQDILGVIPSYWVDEHYAGAATSYYRYAELSTSAKLIEAPEEQIAYLNQFMAHYQPEGKFTPLEATNPLYSGSLNTILIVEFTIESFKAKWKLGQNRPIEIRKKVAENFLARNQGNDARCAQEIVKWIQAHQS